MNNTLLWLEIPVSDFERAVIFYEKVFDITLDVRTLFDTQMALFTKEQIGVKGSLIQIKNHPGSNGIKPIFYVEILNEAIIKVKKNGGVVVSEPTLLRQKNKEGDVIIGANLIDNQVGYYSEIMDSEKNHIYLYSHS
jgi:predicted enzyme related to lactoylglutathione lyase